MEEELDRIVGVGDGGDLISPFTEEILKTKFSGKITRPAVTHYDRTTDPKVILSHFRYAMINQDFTSIYMCKFFLEYLTGSANEWFTELPQ